MLEMSKTRVMVDKDLQAMILPLSLMQNIMFCPKFRIKNNRITPISFIQKFVALFGTIVFIYLYFQRIYLLYIIQYINKNNFFELYTCSYYSFGIAMNFYDSIVQTKLYFEFVLLIQRVHRLLNDENHFRVFIISNWCRIIAVYGFFLCILIKVSMWIPLPWYYIASCYSMVAFDLNLVYAISLITLLKDKIVLWTIRASNLQGLLGENGPKKMYQSYVDILNCYAIYKECFGRNILYYISEVFVHSLVYFQIALNTVKIGISNARHMDAATSTLLSVYIWVAKNLFLQLILCLYCEKFYIAVESAQDICTILKSYPSGGDISTNETRKLGKNVVRLHRASFSKIRACGLFYVDAALQLGLMGLLTNYTIVLLQFAFL